MTLAAPSGMLTETVVPSAGVSELFPTVTVYVKAAPATASVGPLTFVVTSTVVAATAGAAAFPAAIAAKKLIDMMMATRWRHRRRRPPLLGLCQMLCLKLTSIFRSDAHRGELRLRGSEASISPANSGDLRRPAI